jgi:hypothetical protein
MPFPYTFPITFGADLEHFIDTPMTQTLRVLVWDDYDKTYLIDDLTDAYNQLQFSTALHGGFSRLSMVVPMPIERIWLYLERENLPGRHFAHIEVLEEQYVAWEGRIMVVGFDPSGASLSLRIEASGYWGSCRDQLYDPTDAGHTDWTSGSNHFANEIIAEMLTSKCPDISTDQTALDSPGLDLAGIDLTARDYPQNVIVAKIPMTSDGTDQWFFAVWENRKPYLKQRISTTLHWTTYMSELGQGSMLSQDAYQLRNNILPVKDGVEGTAAADDGRRSTVPLRDLALTIQKGVPTAAMNEERDRALAEKKQPQQSQRFVVTGRVWSTKDEGIFQGTPLWRVRAGEVMRINDLVPASVATPTFDALRTFYINETTYDAVSNKLTVVPDRPPNDMTRLVTRSIQTELDR